MIQHMFCVKDKAADAFLPPFFLPTRAMAVRTFGQCARDGNHQFCKAPLDYSLYELGTFDDAVAAFELLPEPRFIVSADSLGGEGG